jgi:SAM-dependent methyltransferase
MTKSTIRLSVLALGLATYAPSTMFAQPARTPDVHFVPTPMEVVNAMLSVARVGKTDRLYDLGSGDGRIVITAAKRFGTRGTGIDIDPQRITESNRNADTAGVKNLVEFRQADLFQTNLRDATVVTLYLLPRLNVQLRPKLFTELRPGTRVVSHAFDMGDWAADSTMSLDGRTVYYWVMPAKVDGAWNLTAPSDGQNRTYQLRLTQTYQKLAGTALAGNRPFSVDSARVLGDSVMFTLSENNGSQRLRFAGRLSGGTLSGSLLGASGSWRATR